MDWKIFLIVVLINSLLCLAQYVVQKIDRKRGRISPRNSIIPGTENQKFLYWQDFYNQTYGDFLGLVWVMNGFVQLLVIGQISLVDWTIFIIIAIVSALAFLYLNLQDAHKPDWGYPKQGEVSLGGYVHLLYFGIMLAMAVIDVIKMINGSMSGLIFWTTVGGMVIYLITTIFEIKAGHFDPLKKIIG